MKKKQIPIVPSFPGLKLSRLQFSGLRKQSGNSNTTKWKKQKKNIGYLALIRDTSCNKSVEMGEKKLVANRNPFAFSRQKAIAA